MAYEKYDYSSEYQDHILACLMKHPNKFLCYTGILSYKYFVGTARMVTARTMFGYWQKWSRFPTWDVLQEATMAAIDRTKEGKEETTVVDYLKRVQQMDTGDVDSIVAEVVQFATHRSVWHAIEDIYTAHAENKEPEGGWIKRITDALLIGTNVTDLGYIIGPQREDEIKAIIKEYKRVGRGVQIGGAFHLLDDVWKLKGGFGPGWLISILAPPKGLKTTFCINLAMNMAFGGQPVFYYPCEITQIDASMNCLHCLTDCTAELLYSNEEAFTQRALRNANDLMKAPLLIKGYASRTVSIAKEIRAHAMASKEMLGIKPRAVFIDFAETVNCSVESREMSEHRASAAVYVEARALGADLGCPVFLPDRCNADGMAATVIGKRHFQGALEKSGHVDVGISLNSSDEEKLAHQIRYFIFLNRHGDEGLHYRGSFNSKVMRMTLDEKISWNPEEERDEDRPGRARRKPRRPPDVDRMMD